MTAPWRWTAEDEAAIDAAEARRDWEDPDMGEGDYLDQMWGRAA
jgi:hypothetical protein